MIKKEMENLKKRCESKFLNTTQIKKEYLIYY